MTADRVKLYRHIPQPGQPITVRVQTFPVDDSIPEDKDISWAVRRLRLNRSGGPSGMRAEHPHQWLIDATRYDTPDATNWKKVFDIMQAAFRDGTLADESM